MGLEVMVVAVDFSEVAVRVYEAAADLADRLRARVVLPAAAALAVWMLVVGTYNPFIYFRF
jgi:hypothetical protein